MDMLQLGLSGKVAVVTGGDGGIGLGMARGLCEPGIAVLGKPMGDDPAWSVRSLHGWAVHQPAQHAVAPRHR